ncbi:MAG: hypothetical protein LQ340_004357 [Diploschistes diacapsis]|nr:MAG: hypothetical protein LQ340_004357 [Diploschistes diacapsis]
MKTFSALLAASAITTAIAQTSSVLDPNDAAPTTLPGDDATQGSDGLWTVTEYTNDCSTLSGSELGAGSYSGTVVNTLTDTLPCSECEQEQTTSQPGIWTTYTTAYVETCSTGETMKTYTITESCSEENQPRPSSYVPSGFTVTTVSCDVCEHPTVTLTTPCEETETPKGTPAAAPSTPSAAPAAPATTAPPQAGPTAPAAPLAASPAAPASAPPSAESASAAAPPASAPAPSAHGYVAVNTSTVVCPDCAPNATSSPIAIAKASTSSLSCVMVAMWAVVAGLCVAL